MEDFIRNSNEYHQKEIMRLCRLKCAYELAIKEIEEEISRVQQSDKELYSLLEEINNARPKP